MSYIKIKNTGTDSADWATIKNIYVKIKNTGTDSADWVLVKNGFVKTTSIAVDSIDWNLFYTSSVLAPPTNFAATVISSSEIDLSWTVESGATFYDIYRSTTNTAPASSTSPTYSGISGSTSSYKNTGLSNTSSNTYYYWIRSNTHTQTSAWSGPVGNAVLNPPANFTLSLNTLTDVVTLSWSKVTNATYYTLYKNTIDVIPQSGQNLGNVSTTTDQLPTNSSVTYYYWLTANNNLTASSYAPSNPISVTSVSEVPGAPTVSGSWDPNSENINITSSAWGTNTTYVVINLYNNSGLTGTPVTKSIGTSTGFVQFAETPTSSNQVFYWTATPYNGYTSPATAGATTSAQSVTVTGLTPPGVPTLSATSSFAFANISLTAIDATNTTDVFLEFGTDTTYSLFQYVVPESSDTGTNGTAVDINTRGTPSLPISTYFGNTQPHVSGTILANNLSGSGSLSTSASVGTTYYWRARASNKGVDSTTVTGTITTVPLIYNGTASISGTGVSGTTLTGSTNNWLANSTITNYFVVLQRSTDNVNWTTMSATAVNGSTIPESTSAYTIVSGDVGSYFRAAANATSSDGTSATVYSTSIKATAAVPPTFNPPNFPPTFSTTYYYAYSVCNTVNSSYVTAPTYSTTNTLPPGTNANQVYCSSSGGNDTTCYTYNTTSSSAALAAVAQSACTPAPPNFPPTFAPTFNPPNFPPTFAPTFTSHSCSTAQCIQGYCCGCGGGVGGAC